MSVVKITNSISGIWKPDLDGSVSKKLGGPGEYSALKLIASGGAASVAIYDATELSQANSSNIRWYLDASTTDVDSDIFSSALTFSKGLFAVLEQGTGTNPIVCVAKIKSS